jgi:DNA polymerase-1
MAESSCELYECAGCPFRGPKVGARGNPLSPIIIIGESPGRQELKAKLPFVGPSGKVLDAVLAQYPDLEPYYINAMQCYPGDALLEKDDTSMNNAVATCRHHVLDEIAKAPRKVILALGAPAIRSVTENYDLKITQERGRFMLTPLASIGMVASVHPAFLMRGGAGATFQQFKRDLDYAAQLCRGKPPKRPPTVDYTIAETVEDIEAFAESVKDNEYVGADVETSGFSHLEDYILCAGFSDKPEHVFVVPENLVKHVGTIFKKSKARFVWHNGKFDVKFLWAAGIEEARCDDDTMLMSYTLDENGGIHDLERVAADWLDSPNWKAMLDQYRKNKKESYSVIPRPVLHKYMAYDVGNTHAICHILRPRISSDKFCERLYTRTLIPAGNFLARVECNGIHVDLARVEENEAEYGEAIKRLGDELLEFGKAFPDSGYTEKLPNSPQQLKKLLYDDLKIPVWRNKRSTDKKVIEKVILLQGNRVHPIFKVMSKYRKVAKERGTYVTPARIHLKSDGRVHSTYKLHGTRTGRLASSDPNVQNVPRNPKIRGQYIAAPGRRLVEADLNQAELRILATLSKDPELCRIYLTEGMSLHDEVRAEIWGHVQDWSPRDVSRYLEKFRLTEATRYDEKGADLLVAEQKMRAKNVNFGVVYGITAAGLADQTDSSPLDAQMWIDKWFKRFKLAGEFIESCKMAPVKGQTLITNFGRKKRPGVVSQELLHGIMNEFANFPMQSPASDCTLHAGVTLEEPLKEYDAKIVNLIHDALLIEVPDDDAIVKKVADMATAEMALTPKKWGYNIIPFVADAKQGYRWGSLGKIAA